MERNDGKTNEPTTLIVCSLLFLVSSCVNAKNQKPKIINHKLEKC